MKSLLQIALIQTHLTWENPVQNRTMFSEKIADIASSVDLIILPEMFTTGFTMDAPELAETMQGPTIDWMQQMAATKNSAIAGSLIIKEEEQYYNRLVFVFPDGNIQYYDKHHLFTLAKEEKVFTAGNKEVVVDYLGWKIKLLVCYDLRFPVWARNTSNYDILLYVASWPKPRINAWDALLKARAIENMCYCIGVNRVGLDGKGFEYNGHSAIYDELGNSLLADHPIEKEQILYVNLDKEPMLKTREKLNFLNDADRFQLI